MAESNPQDEVDVELPVEESPEALPSDADQDSDAEADETTGGGVPVDDSKGEDCPPCKGGAPGWMATFADMATLLMAFFCSYTFIF